MKKLICLFTLLAFVCVPFAQAQKTARKGRRASAKKDMTGCGSPEGAKSLGRPGGRVGGSLAASGSGCC